MDTRALVAILLLSAVLYGVVTYNQITHLRHRVSNAWHQVEIQLESRDRLVEQLLDLDALHADHQREMVAEILAARNELAQGHSARELAPGHAKLHEALQHFLTIVEGYPDAPEISGSLVDQIARAEDKLCFTQQYYNDQVTRLNSKLSTIPSRWVGALARVRTAELFDASPDRAMPMPRA